MNLDDYTIAKDFLDKCLEIIEAIGYDHTTQDISLHFHSEHIKICTACTGDFYFSSWRANFTAKCNGIIIPELNGGAIQSKLRVISPAGMPDCGPSGSSPCNQATNPPCSASGNKYCGNQAIPPAVQNDYWCINTGVEFTEIDIDKLGISGVEDITYNVRTDPPEPPDFTWIKWGSNYQTKIPPPYEWQEEYNNIHCQLESMPEDVMRDIAVGLPYVLNEITNIICCTPRPCFLMLVDNWYAEQLIIAIRNYYLTFEIVLYFPILPGSGMSNDGVPVTQLCYKFKYRFQESETTLLDIKTDYQEFVQRFIDTINQIASTKTDILSNNYGLNIQDQNQKKIQFLNISLDNKTLNITQGEELETL